MAQATTTTYLQIESIGADKLIASMNGLQKSMNYVAGMLKSLNNGLGLLPVHSKKGAAAIEEQAKAAQNATQSATELRIALAAQMNTTADLAKAVKGLSDEQKKQSKALDWQALESKINLVKDAYNALKGAAISVFQESMKLSEAWENQEKVELKLESALKEGGIKTSINDFKNWASEVQNSTRFGDEFVLNLASISAAFTKTGSQTKAITKAALDYSAATGQDATAAAQSMGKALGGNAKALQNLGIYLNSNEQELFKNAKEGERFSFIIGKMAEKYGGFAEAMAQTPTGAFTQIQGIIGDIQEQLGRIVSPTLWAGLSLAKDIFNDILGEINKITTDAETLKSIQTAITNGLATAAAVIIDIKAGIELIENVLGIIAKGVLAAFTAAFKEWGVLFNKLGDLEILPDKLQGALRKMGESLSLPFDFAVEGIKGNVSEVGKILEKAEEDKNKLYERLEAKQREFNKSTKLTLPSSAGKDTGKTTLAPQVEDIKLGGNFKVELDNDLTALMDFYSKTEEIQKQFAAKRAAVEQSEIIDYQTKLEYKKSLDEQEQESLRNIKLEYARQTNDELALIEDQYRQENAAKEKAAAEELSAQKKELMQSLAQNLTSVANLGVDMLTSWIEGTGDWREQLYEGLKSFSKNLMTTSIASLINSAIINQAKAQESQAAIPVIGPALALAAGATMFAVTMALKSKLKPAEIEYAHGGFISAGMVRGGSFGRDSVSALLAPGERVLSAKEAKEYENNQYNKNVNLTVNLSAGIGTDGNGLQKAVRQYIIPEIKRAAIAGYKL